jgi:hypothetical protein
MFFLSAMQNLPTEKYLSPMFTLKKTQQLLAMFFCYSAVEKRW